jgi:tRNA(Ile)-lysidine synthase
MVSSRTILTRFHEYSRRRRLIGEQGHVIAAVSGGVDSMVLLDLLVSERESLGLSLIVAHFNHQLRGEESDADEAFVVQRAGQYGLEVYVDRANTAEVARLTRTGIQEAARNLRYDFFAKLLESSGYDALATAHNADDNAETVLLNLFRGAGVLGLSGIPVARPDTKIIRPLLFARREEIEEYAEAARIPFRTDSSNAGDAYTRNFIRHQVLPLVRDQINPNIVETLHRSSELFRELEAFLAYTARTAFDVAAAPRVEGSISLSIPRLRSHPVLLQQYVVMLAAQSVTGRKPEFEQVNRALELTDGLTGSLVMLSDRHGIYRDRDALVLRTLDVHPDYRINILADQQYEFNDFRFSSELIEGAVQPPQGDGTVEHVDADSLPPGQMVLRTWTEGDWFIPLGMRTRKKISDYFVDAKIPLYEKRTYPILETKEGAVIWLCGHRIDDRFKITAGTRRVLRLRFTRTKNGSHPDGERGPIRADDQRSEDQAPHPPARPVDQP